MACALHATTGMETDRDLIIVTGSTGLIGRAAIDRLADHYRIVRFARDPDPDLPGDGHEVDLTDATTMRDALADVRDTHGRQIASVIHLAAYYDFSGEPSPLYREVTVEGTRRLMRALRDGGFDVEQFLFSSSMLVHAPQEPDAPSIDEDDPLDPRWDYPRSKARTEELIRDERGEMPAVLARIAGIYDEWGHSIPLAHQIQRIFEQDPHAYLFPGDPDRGQSFLHLDDLIDAIERIVDRRRDLPGVTTLLLGEDGTLGYGELQNRIGQLIHGRDWPTIRIPAPIARAGAWLEGALPGADPFIKPWMIEFADDHYDLDVGRAREELGWRPRRSLDDTLEAIIANLLADPERWYAENDLDPSGIPEERRQAAAAQR